MSAVGVVKSGNGHPPSCTPLHTQGYKTNFPPFQLIHADELRSNNLCGMGLFLHLATNQCDAQGGSDVELSADLCAVSTFFFYNHCQNQWGGVGKCLEMR